MNKPQPSEFDKYANRYESDLQESLPTALAEDQYFAAYKVNHIAYRLDGGELQRLLDFGCGVGRSLCLLNKQFPNAELWGYDISTQSVELARKRAVMAYLTSNLDDLPEAGFDAILAANVFHHIPPAERKDALLRGKKLLRDNGRLFVFEHNPFNPLTRLVFERCPYDKGAIMLPRRETLKLADEVGLRVIRSDYTLFFPPQLGRLRSLERLFGWLPLGAQYCVEMAK
jgi:SAM-dependent methyltransferase